MFGVQDLKNTTMSIYVWYVHLYTQSLWRKSMYNYIVCVCMYVCVYMYIYM